MFFSDLKKWVMVAAIGITGTLGTVAIAQEQDADAQSMAQGLAQEVAGKKQLQSEEMSLIAEQHFSLGKEYYDEGSFDKALDEFNTVLDISPSHEQAKQFRLQCIQAIANGSKPLSSMAADVTPAQKEASVQALGARESYRQGLEAYRQGDVDQAERKFQIALAINPRYLPAKRMLQRILERDKEVLDRDHDLLWAERTNDVRKSWLPTGKVNKRVSGEQGGENIMTTEKQKMLEACKQVIPEINFTQAHIRDVLQYLSKITGVNIILDERVFEAGFTPSSSGSSKDEDEDTSSAKASASGPVSETITISLSNIPLIEALRYILKVKGLSYRIDDFAILVSTPEGIGDETMETRYYHMSSGIGEFMEFKPNTEATDTGGVKEEHGISSQTLSPEERTTIKDVLVNSGVPFPPGSNAFMDKRTGTLIVHNTPDNLTMVEKILSIIDKAPFQVNIQAKFVRISQNDLEELGFEWSLLNETRIGRREEGQDRITLGPVGTSIDGSGNLTNDEIGSGVSLANALGKTTGTALTGAINSTGNKADLPNFASGSALFSMWGVLTDPQFRMVMHALDKTGNADLLSAPSVTTVNNQQAQIELVDEIIYPGEYDLQPPTVTSGQNPTVTPGVAVPGDFQTRDVGVILNVTPSVGSDRKTITLTLIPEVSEYVDDKDYGTDFVSTLNTIDGPQTTTQHLPILVPIFRTSNVSATVIVNDGETIVLGGLIEEKKTTIHDKTPFLGDIPFIGRLFRHDLEQSQKMNLMIFVTAKLINASGEDLHQSEG